MSSSTMKLTFALISGLCLSWNVEGHNVFSKLLVNNTETADWEYVREVADAPGHTPEPRYPLLYKEYPQFTPSVLTPDNRCGREAWKPSLKTGIADVIAGSEVGFRVGVTFPDVENSIADVFHHGPAFVYLARKPANVSLSEWDGDGDYFKIDYKGPLNDTEWFITRKKEYNFTIPKTTLPGQYLLRVEDIWPRMQNDSQFYVNCAQINIIGEGGGTPTEFARFPGTYKVDSVGIRVPDGVEYYPSDGKGSDWRWVGGFMQYIPPGPPVWTG